MKTTTDAQHAVEFLRWLFGDDPDGYIYILRQRPSSDPGEARQDKLDLNPAAFSKPEKVDSLWWEEQSHLWSQAFSTATIKDRTSKQNNHGVNCQSIPALWCDIDACKDLGIPGEEFYTELKGTEDVSGWIRSSENGIQAFWKLDEPYQSNGNKEQFAEDLAGVLYDICYYYGGDTQVVNLGRLMRLPGSINIKKEYTRPVMARATRLTDETFSLRSMKKRFKPDPEIVPRVVAYAVIKALTEVWGQGERHFIILQLAGTIRKNGINKDACKNLVKEVMKFFGDNSDRSSEIDTTYDTPIETLASLRTDYGSVADPVERAIQFWKKLKVTYCKKRGFEFHPEDVDPTQSEQDDAMFQEKGFDTFFNADSVLTKFSNFVVKLRGRLIKADTNTSVWLADIFTQGEPPALIEISTEKHSQWHKFLTIKGMPVGLSIEQPKLWAQYVSYLASICPDVSLRETSFYGWLDVQKTPTLVMPHTVHDNYQWTGNDDLSAKPGALEQLIGREEAVEYLTNFAENYKTCHEDRLIWPTLGWFASCAIKGLFWQRFHGYPALVINGLSQSGKTWLAKEVLGMHYGASTQHSFASSAFAAEKYMMGSNICPLIVDEFRNLDKLKVARTLEIMRALFDGSLISRGKSGGEGVDKSKVETPLCLIGEHQYEDEATVSRSFIITVNRSWLGDLGNLDDEDRREHTRKLAWLMDRRWTGYLGSLMIRWSANHLDDVYRIIGTDPNEDPGLAQILVKDTCPSPMPRKQDSCTSVISGLMLMSEMYKDYGVDFPLKKRAMLEAIYSSDASLNADHTYDTQTLKHLFEMTDQIIVEGHRTKMSHEHSLYAYDLDDQNFMYIDMIRWYRLLRPLIQTSDAATLTDKHGFIDLLKDNHQREGSVFTEFSIDHPEFGKCVKVDLKRVAELYGVSVQQWRGINGYQDT